MLAARGRGGDAARARELAATGLAAAEEMRLAGTAEDARAFLAHA
jgi:hypothetical protein